MDGNTILVALLKLVHVSAAAFWFGGGLYLYMLAKADLAGDFAVAARYNAMIARVSKVGLGMPIASMTTTVVGILLYIVMGYYNRGFGGLGSIIFHIGVLAGIAATAHGATSFGKSVGEISRLTTAAVGADGSVNQVALGELNTAQKSIVSALNIHVILVVVAFSGMVLGSTIFP